MHNIDVPILEDTILYNVAYYEDPGVLVLLLVVSIG